MWTLCPPYNNLLSLESTPVYCIYVAGIDESKLEFVMELKNIQRGRISEYVKAYPNAQYVANKTPWEVKCDVALPCATQNELHGPSLKTIRLYHIQITLFLVWFIYLTMT